MAAVTRPSLDFSNKAIVASTLLTCKVTIATSFFNGFSNDSHLNLSQSWNFDPLPILPDVHQCVLSSWFGGQKVEKLLIVEFHKGHLHDKGGVLDDLHFSENVSHSPGIRDFKMQVEIA